VFFFVFSITHNYFW